MSSSTLLYTLCFKSIYTTVWLIFICLLNILSQDAYLEYLEMGYWKKEDCKKVSDASGGLLAVAGGLLEK